MFDLALVAAVIRGEDLAGRIDWQMKHFLDSGKYKVAYTLAPRQVESVISHRILDRKHIVVGVSGGVSVDTREFGLARILEMHGLGKQQ